MSSVKVDFGELSNDAEFKERIHSFQSKLDEVTKMIDTILSVNIYDNLTPEDKIRYDLFLSFSINSLFWFYLRIQGRDPSQHDLKNELNRVKEYMTKSRKLYERKTIMPRIDQGAAKRFIRSGLFDLHNRPAKDTDENSIRVNQETEGNSLKRKRSDSDNEK